MKVLIFSGKSGHTVGSTINTTPEYARLLVQENIGSITDFNDVADPYPAGKSAFVEVRLVRPSDTTQYTANDVINSSVSTPVSTNLPGVAIANGGGFWITGINVRTNLLNLANSTIRIHLYRTVPASIPGDNLPMVQLDANTASVPQFFDVTFGDFLSGGDVVTGQISPMTLMQCDAASINYKLVIQTLATFTPVSAGFIDLSFTLLQL